MNKTKFSIIITTIFLCSITATNVYADQPGSQKTPYIVYVGWQGPGYYYFTTNNYETGFVSDVCQLNSISMKITSYPLGHPYDPNQIALCTATVPEFPSTVFVLLISIVSSIVFYRTLIRK